MKLTIQRMQLPGDLHTPVGLYRSLRDHYPGALLLESSDYHDAGNSSSFICLQPLKTLQLHKGVLTTDDIYAGKSDKAAARETFKDDISLFLKGFELSETNDEHGVFGYIAYDAIRYFEDIELKHRMEHEFDHPEMMLSAFRFVVRLNHFNDTMHITEYCPASEKPAMAQLLSHIRNQHDPVFPFEAATKVHSNLTDDQYLAMVGQAKFHCRRGDVFQVVLSRRFSVGFKGDDLNVYRALRRINPSPYLYYFDYGSFRIFGSSPESQLRIKRGIASLNPIAGTYKRTGNDEADKALSEELAQDPKENAEHAMLVDLARNDLSRSCHQVKVETYKELQFFSHVIHLVSKVQGMMDKPADAIQTIGDTFPAGTLSGAPKHRAMQIIDELEPQSRGYYGGAVGFIGFNGDVNMAILIRSFLSKNNTLFFQAGAGIVERSVPESELQEVNNKLAALHKAIDEANTNNPFRL